MSNTISAVRNIFEFDEFARIQHWVRRKSIQDPINKPRGPRDKEV